MNSNDSFYEYTVARVTAPSTLPSTAPSNAPIPSSFCSMNTNFFLTATVFHCLNHSLLRLYHKEYIYLHFSHNENIQKTVCDRLRCGNAMGIASYKSKDRLYIVSSSIQKAYSIVAEEKRNGLSKF